VLLGLCVGGAGNVRVNGGDHIQSEEDVNTNRQQVEQLDAH
jgi:hypothetical protein